MTSIKDQHLDDFQSFEDWLDKDGLLGQEILYRGQPDSALALESTLYRYQRELFDAKHPSVSVPLRDYASIAKKLQTVVEQHTDRDFGDLTVVGEAFPTAEQREGRVSLEYAAYLRHHGFPSPLLDWTLSPYVAAYFAFNTAHNANKTEGQKAGNESRVAIYAMRPPKSPYGEYTSFGEYFGEGGGLLHYHNAIKGEPRHFVQQASYTVALRKATEDWKTVKGFEYISHEYVMQNFPQFRAPGSNRMSYENAIGDAICWKATLPTHERERVLRRLDKMNINAYTLFLTEDALVQTYGTREFRRSRLA